MVVFLDCLLGSYLLKIIWRVLRLQRLNQSKSREHSNSSCLWKLNSNSWNIYTMIQSFIYEITYYFYHRPFLPSIHRTPSVQSMKPWSSLLFVWTFPHLVQKQHNAVTEVEDFKKKKLVVCFGQKNISWTTAFSPCLISMNPVRGWNSFNSDLG